MACNPRMDRSALSLTAEAESPAHLAWATMAPASPRLRRSFARAFLSTKVPRRRHRSWAWPIVQPVAEEHQGELQFSGQSAHGRLPGVPDLPNIPSINAQQSSHPARIALMSQTDMYYGRGRQRLRELLSRKSLRVKLPRTAAVTPEQGLQIWKTEQIDL